MDCQNHLGIAAATRCVGCAEPFCPNCLITIKGQTYCGACKVMVLEGRKPVFLTGTQLSTEAKEALITALFSSFCIGFILGPVAIYRATAAKKAIAKNPQLTGNGMANAAIVVGVIGLAIWVLGIYKISAGPHR